MPFRNKHLRREGFSCCSCGVRERVIAVTGVRRGDHNAFTLIRLALAAGIFPGLGYVAQLQVPLGVVEDVAGLPGLLRSVPRELRCNCNGGAWRLSDALPGGGGGAQPRTGPVSLGRLPPGGLLAVDSGNPAGNPVGAGKQQELREVHLGGMAGGERQVRQTKGEGGGQQVLCDECFAIDGPTSVDSPLLR